jgi:hypothetical protein
MAENLPSKVAAADQRFSHLISEEALGECRVVAIGGAVAHATQFDCFKQTRTPSCRHPQIFRDIPLRINRGPRSITPFPEEGARKHAHFLVFATPCARVMLIIRAIRKRGRRRPLREDAARPSREGAGKTGCALHPRSRVQKTNRTRTRAYRFSGSSPAFPAQWFYGLLRALLGDRLFCHHHLREACFPET